MDSSVCKIYTEVSEFWDFHKNPLIKFRLFYHASLVLNSLTILTESSLLQVVRQYLENMGDV